MLTAAQYRGLAELYSNYREKGLEILAFPCNQFASQENKCELDIKLFVQTKFDVKFPMFSKIDVNGPNTHPLYRYLRAKSALFDKKHKLCKEIPWNFTKFLVEPNGNVTGLYAPDMKPAVVESDIEVLMMK